MDRIGLEKGGVDVEAALARMMGNEALLARLLGKFVDDESCARLSRAVEAHDEEAAIEASHTLKGIAGNLSITPVYELASRQCDLFRDGSWEEAAALMPRLVAAHDVAKAAIEACV